MIRIRRAHERGHTQIGWLDSWHSFSFGDYFDPQNVGFRSLRVLNDDRVIAGAGFGTHGHRDMEILSYVLEGELEHRDSLGNGSIIRPGEIQFMRAGTGVMHSERNPSNTSPVHFLQIWVVPQHRGLAPGYAQQAFDPNAVRSSWIVLASPDGRDGSIQVDQDVVLKLAWLDPGAERALHLDDTRQAWLHLATGSAVVNGQALDAGDGAAVSGEKAIEVQSAAESGGGAAAPPAQLLVFDLV